MTKNTKCQRNEFMFWKDKIDKLLSKKGKNVSKANVKELFKYSNKKKIIIERNLEHQE